MCYLHTCFASLCSRRHRSGERQTTIFSSYFRLNILQYPYIPFCSFSLVVKCRTSNLRVLGSNPHRGTQFFPLSFSFFLILNNPRGLWAPVFIFFTVINCKIPLCSFNNTFNSWFIFVDPLPTPPRPDPDWTPSTPTPTFSVL